MQVVRRDAARVKTILNQKAAAAAGKPEMPKRILQGTVTSDKNEQTITVLVERRFTHPVLKKTVRQSKKYRAHDAENKFKVGDTRAHHRVRADLEDQALDGDGGERRGVILRPSMTKPRDWFPQVGSNTE